MYRLPLALLTDLYQLTMAQGYRQAGKDEVEAAGPIELFGSPLPAAGLFSRIFSFLTSGLMGRCPLHCPCAPGFWNRANDVAREENVDDERHDRRI